MNNIKSIRYLTYSLFTVILLLSCISVSAKRKITYSGLTPTIKAKSSLNICIATLDQREVVLKRKQNARFVGYIRASVGIAYPIMNSSDENFSEVMSTSIEDAFKKNGCLTSQIKTNYSSSKEAVVKDLNSREADIYILVTINKWRSDTKSFNMMKLATDLIYNLTVEIYTKTGELIASNNIREVEFGLSPSGIMTTKKIEAKVINSKYPEVMTALFEDTEIEKILE